MATWTNQDGLAVRFGNERAEVGAAEANGLKLTGHTAAEERTLVVTIDNAANIPNTDTTAATGDLPFIPSGAIIKDAYLVVNTAFTSGGSATLDLGTKLAAGTNVDDDGIDVAIAVAALTDNAVIACNGAQIGARATADWYPMATYDTAAFTAGAGKLVIKYLAVME